MSVCNPNPDCRGECSDNRAVVVSRTPQPGTTVGSTTAASNTAVIVYSRQQKLESFHVAGPTGTVLGTLSADVGTFGTTFSLLPNNPIPVGVYTAFVKTIDTLRNCRRTVSWSWTVTT